MSRAPEPAELSADPPRRRGRLRRIVVASLLLLPVLALVVLVLSEDRIERVLLREARAAIERSTGGDLRVEELDIRWLRPGIVVGDLRVEVPSAPGHPPFLLEVRRGRAELAYRGLAALPAGRLHLSRLELDGVRCELDRTFLDSLESDSDDTSRDVDLRIDRLRIEDSAFRYEESDLPLSVDVRDASLEATWNAFRRTVSGRAEATADLDTDLFRHALPLRASTSFRLNDARVELFDGLATAPGVEVRLDEQNISWDDRTFVTARGVVRGDLATASEWLAGDLPPIEGSVAGSIAVSRADGPVQVRADLSVSDLAVGPIRSEESRLRVALDPDRAVLDIRDAAALGGRVEGRLTVSLASDRTIDADLRGRRVATSAVLALLGIPMPFSGQGGAEMRFHGRADERESWSGSGRFEIAPGPPTAGRIPLSGSGTVEIASGTARVLVPDAAIAGAVLRVEVEQDLLGDGTGRVRLTGRTDDARRTQEATWTVLRSFGVEVPAWMTTPLRGSGTLATDVRLAAAEVESVVFGMEIDEGSWGEEPFERLAVEVALDPRRIAIPRVEAVGTGWLARAALEIERESATLLEAEIEAVGVPVEVANRIGGLGLPEIGGTVDGAASLRTEEGGLRGTGRLRLRNVSWEGETLDEAEAAFVAEDDRALFTDLRAHGPAIDLRGELDVRIAERSARLDISESAVDLGRLEIARRNAPEIDARLAVRGSLEVDDAGWSGTLDLEGDDWRLAGRSLPPLDGRVELSSESASFRLASREDDSWAVEGTVGWDESLPLDAAVRVDRLGLDMVIDPTAPSAWARVTGEATVHGPLARPEELRVDGTLRQLDVRVGTRTLRATSDVPIRFGEGTGAIGPFDLEGRSSSLRAFAEISAADGSVRTEIDGFVDLGVINAIVPDASATGRLDVHLAISGALDDPVVSGTLSLAEGRVRFLGFAQPLEAVRLRATLDGDEVRISDLGAILGGGELQGDGGILLEGLGIDSYRLEVDGANVRVAYPSHFRGVYEGTLVLRGDAEAAELGGDLRMLRGEYDQPIELGSIFGGASREYSSSEELDLPARIYLDIGLQADGNVWVRNDLIQAEADFDLQIGGDLRRPEVIGRVRVFEGGRMRFRNNDYRIDSATLDFLDLDRIDPIINLRASTTVEQYEVQLHIEGKVDRFEYELTSTPALSQADIIALLTTGSTLQELAAQGGNRDFSGDLAATYFAGALTGRFERELEQVLRVERFQISPILVGGSGDPTARVTIGKEVADDVLLVYSQEFGPNENQLYQVQWRASRRISLTGERDTLGGIGGEVLYADHFWWRLPPDDAGPLTAPKARRRSGPTAEAFIGDVRIRGVAPDQYAEVRGKIPLEQGDPYRRSALFEGSQQIREWFVARDRVEARIDIETDRRADRPEIVDVTYVVEPGPLVRIDLVGVSGRPQRRILDRLKRQWADSSIVDLLREDAVAEVRRFYHERGYYTADVVASLGEVVDGARTLRLEIDPGPKVRVAEVVLEGNQAVSTERVERQMLTRESSTLSRKVLVPETLEEDVRAIRNLYRDQGYLDVRLEPPAIRLAVDGGTARVVLRIREGPRASIGDVELIEPPAGFEPDELREWSGLVAGDVFAPGRLLEAEVRLRGELDRRGHPDARVEARGVPDDEVVDVQIRVNAGPRREIARIDVAGNFATKDYIIRRELRFTVGDPVSREQMLRSQQALYRLGIFRNVRIGYEPIPGATDPAAHVVRVEIEEAPPFGVTVGAGYDSEAKFKGSFGASHSNVGGRDRTVSLQGRVSSIQERIQAIVEEPRLFSRPLTALFSILRDTQDQPEFTVARRATAFRIEKRLDPRWTTFYRYNYQRVDLSNVREDALESIQDQRLEDVILGDVGISALRSTRDDPFTPTRGTWLEVTGRVFDESLLSEEDFIKSTATFSWTKTLRNGQALSGAVRGGAAFPYGPTDQVPLSERFFAGGDSTLRGFPRDGVEPSGGEGLFLLNQEWRVPVWKSLKGVLFYDAGNVYPTAGDIDPLDLRHVLGAGLRLDTPIGPIRLEYGYKLDRREGESSGEFFVAIGNPF